MRSKPAAGRLTWNEHPNSDLRYCFLGLCSDLRPTLFRCLRNRRPASSRQDALLHADNFALHRAAQCFCSRSYTASLVRLNLVLGS
jgi:hypothetical protein